MAFKITRVGHLVLRVKDVERSRRFFEEVMGFPVVATNERGMVFFSTDVKDNHHMLAIMPAKPGVQMPAVDQVGMQHVSFELGNFAELQDAWWVFRHISQSASCKMMAAQSPGGNTSCGKYPDTARFLDPPTAKGNRGLIAWTRSSAAQELLRRGDAGWTKGGGPRRPRRTKKPAISFANALFRRKTSLKKNWLRWFLVTLGAGFWSGPAWTTKSGISLPA